MQSQDSACFYAESPVFLIDDQTGNTRFVPYGEYVQNEAGQGPRELQAGQGLQDYTTCIYEPWGHRLVIISSGIHLFDISLRRRYAYENPSYNHASEFDPVLADGSEEEEYVPVLVPGGVSKEKPVMN